MPVSMRLWYMKDSGGCPIKHEIVICERLWGMPRRAWDCDMWKTRGDAPSSVKLWYVKDSGGCPIKREIKAQERAMFEITPGNANWDTSMDCDVCYAWMCTLWHATWESIWGVACILRGDAHLRWMLVATWATIWGAFALGTSEAVGLYCLMFCYVWDDLCPCFACHGVML